MNSTALPTRIRGTFLEVADDDDEDFCDLRRTNSAPDGKTAALLLSSGKLETGSSTPETHVPMPQIDEEEGCDEAPLARTANVDYHSRKQPVAQFTHARVKGTFLEYQPAHDDEEDNGLRRATTAPDPHSNDELMSADSRDAALHCILRSGVPAADAADAAEESSRTAVAARVKGTFIEIVEPDDDAELRRTVSAPGPHGVHGTAGCGGLLPVVPPGSTGITVGPRVTTMSQILENAEEERVSATTCGKNRSKRRSRQKHAKIAAVDDRSPVDTQWCMSAQQPSFIDAQDPRKGSMYLQNGASCESLVVARPPPNLHWHPSSLASGDLSGSDRCFMKKHFDGRLSLITEHEIRWDGVHRYCVRFTGNELSMADGVGFALAKRLPCPRNIQKIHSTFVSKRGYLCSRSGESVMRRTMGLPGLETGKLIMVTVNVDEGWVQFEVENREGAMTAAKIPLHQHARPGTRYHGAFCAVIKHEGVGIDFVELASTELRP